MIFNMKLATSSQIKEIDKLSTNKYGIPSLIRMEVAGLKSFDIIKKEYNPKKSLIVVGTGNNGGDGLVIARYLLLNNYECSIYIVKTSKIRSKDFVTNLSIIKKLGVKITNDWKNVKTKEYDLIIDGIFGVGLNRPLNSKISILIKTLNKTKIPICSIDIPSGLDPDSGKMLSTSIIADSTITFDFAKTGLLTDPGAKFSKKIFIVKLPTPETLSKKLNNFYINDNFFNDFIRKRGKSSNKGTFGHVLIVGGSKNMPGAVLLSGLAAYKSGAGLVTLCVPKCISNSLKNKIPEAIILDVPNSTDSRTIDESKFIATIKNNIRKKPSSIVIGPGLGSRKGLYKIIEDSLNYFDCPIILDADALNLISKDFNVLDKYKNQIIITPHPGEMSKITGKSVKEIQANRIKISSDVSRKIKCISVLKGFRTIISSNSGQIYINGSGNEGMATGGMGDALTGIIASFIGQGYSELESTILGVYVHGKAGDSIADVTSKRGILASEIIKKLPKTIKLIEENSSIYSDLERIEN